MQEMMGLTNSLIRSCLINKRISIIVGLIFICLFFYIARSWKYSQTNVTGSVVSFLGTAALPHSSMVGSKCTCSMPCQSFPTPISDKKVSFYEANKSNVFDERVEVNLDTDMMDQVDNERFCVGRSQKFPQAIIIGVKKGGTRALINMLKLHPDINAAKTEIHYFDRDDNFSNGVQWYIEKMPYTSKNQVTIEKSPSYFVVEEVPIRMSTLSPKLKLILIVRNPIDRLVSDFLQLDSKRLKKNGNRYTFEELVFHTSGEVNQHYMPVSVSMYDIHFQKWLKHFNLEQIHIVDGDAMVVNPIHELQKAEKFLGVKTYFHKEMFYFNETKGFYCWKKSGKPTCLGDGKGREHPSLSDTVRSKLQNFFSSHNDIFFELCQCKFSW